MVGADLEDFLGAPEPAPLWRHRVQLPVIEGVLIPPVQIIGGSFSFPFVDSEARAHSGSYTYYPQFNNIDAIDITLLETENYSITRYFYLWFARVVNDADGTYYPSSHFKRVTQLTMQNNLGQDAITIKYNGTFPTRLPNIEPSENEEYYRVSINLSVDSNNPVFLL